MTERTRLIADLREALRAAGAGLSTLNHLVGAHLELRGQDLTVLDMLARDGAATPSEIVGRTGIHPATLTGVLDRLENGGWIERDRDPGDRRRTIIRPIRSRGPELLRLFRPMNDAITDLADSFTDGELAAITRFLRAVADAADTSKTRLGRP
ncbi:MAG: MarR family transcriptional regulator [Acidimicrobiia bacterium]